MPLDEVKKKTKSYKNKQTKTPKQAKEQNPLISIPPSLNATV